MIRILVVDDSTVVADLLKMIFEQQPDMQVIGHARNGREAISMTADLRPDVVTMDIRMPELDGFGATREIMHATPTPIVVISSSVNDAELQTTFRAIEEGALWVIEKPPAIDAPGFESIRRELIDTVRAMSGVRVIRKYSAARRHAAAGMKRDERFELVVVGASTGGPQALAELLRQIPADFPLPIAIVQHISMGFVSGLVMWLQSLTGLTVKLAEANENLQAGVVYVAPDNQHLEVARANNSLHARLRAGSGNETFCPGVNPLFESAAEICGGTAVGILMSGMGSDGSIGMRKIRRAGGYALVQDPTDCIVGSMPEAALRIEAVDEVLGSGALGPRLIELVANGRANTGHRA